MHKARTSYETHLKLLDSYDILSQDDFRTYERYLENPNAFSTVSTTDAAQRRQSKINKFKEAKALKAKIEVLSSSIAYKVSITNSTKSIW